MQCLVFSAWSASEVMGKVIKHKADWSKSQRAVDKAISDILSKELDCFAFPLTYLRWVPLLAAEGSRSSELVLILTPWPYTPNLLDTKETVATSFLGSPPKEPVSFLSSKTLLQVNNAFCRRKEGRESGKERRQEGKKEGRQRSGREERKRRGRKERISRQDLSNFTQNYSQRTQWSSNLKKLTY